MFIPLGDKYFKCYSITWRSDKIKEINFFVLNCQVGLQRPSSFISPVSFFNKAGHFIPFYPVLHLSQIFMEWQLLQIYLRAYLVIYIWESMQMGLYYRSQATQTERLNLVLPKVSLTFTVGTPFNHHNVFEPSHCANPSSIYRGRKYIAKIKNVFHSTFSCFYCINLTSTYTL